MIVVVRTAPRRVSFLADTLRSLDENGARDYERFVWTDGYWPREAKIAGWRITGTISNHGSRMAGWNLIRMLARIGMGPVLWCEDDILVVMPNAVHFMMEWTTERNNVSLTSFFDKRSLPPQAAREDVFHRWQRPAQEFAYSQCLRLPLKTINYLESCDVESVTNGWVKHSWDPSLRHFLMRSPWAHYDCVIPNVIEHMGRDVSAIGNDDAGITSGELWRPDRAFAKVVKGD